ncbi:diaminopimelate epimerase [Lysinibacillus irui]|uniref:Diaminopimelate epimerase n=1 Tax=Lysinibacillus irui TaxID=2998077 RepID=A0AAJ5RJ22_9BACI|nr:MULTISPECIES: diaminopimelate epimerase [Lysinibacillus]MEA0555835.1 diaminopimelate epimerase [Lysinibacillus irui]MEA0976937.1 diaminopimelate epimerase [Lysinibacillus irui]MEA1043091.1 diaminopimelate epimerase [Lysinibacillus irui]WDV06451.1 diaminopimelate epimerase [Lysinibacillus irui]
MKIAFTKMHGIGNSYIYLDLFRYDYNDNIFCELAKKIANVHTGIGSDGLIIIQPSKIADCGMRIFNKDGTEGSNCGNGLRCVAKYIFERQIVRQKFFTIETKAGIMYVEVVVQDNTVIDVIVDMGKPLLYRKDIPMLGTPNKLVINELFTVPPHNLFLTALFLGNPNAVFFIDDIEKAPLRTLGGIIENDVRFPNRVNVEFVQVIHSKALQFRVWERGSGVTEACGTGACAAVVAAILNGFCQRGEEITVHLSGGDLNIRWADDDHVWMRGPAEFIAEGIYEFL